MEVPDPHLSYNGAQRCGAVVSDTEVISPDISDEAVAMPVATMTDRLAKSDIATLAIESEVSRRPIEVNLIRRDHAMGRDETMCKEVTSSRFERELVASQQQYDPHLRSENSSRHSRQSDSEASGMAYRRRRKPEQFHASHRIGEQRRSLDDLRAELTDEMRTQQAMFLSARDELVARQEEMFMQAQIAFEQLRSDKDARSINETRQTQPQSSQDGGGDRVIPASQIEVGRPEDVSQSNRHAAEVGSMRSVQSDRTSVQSNDSETSRRQSRGNALVDAASVPIMGPLYEFGSQSSPYELGRPGILQMILGGMPSGVPPSVYLTPVDAMSQQYAGGDTPMIPGGMPSGVPPSVYRTPVDAMNHPYANRQLVNSQLASTEVSPDLFTPAESAYFTAPNTCLRVNTPRWSTVVIPSNSQNQNESALLGDSGLGRTGFGQSPGTSQSQSQEPRDVQTPISCPTSQSKGNGTKHASFDDEKRVPVYDSEMSDGEDYVHVSGREKKDSAKKSSAKKISAESKRSTSRRDRLQVSQRRSRSRSNRKKSDSDSESQSCDSDQKGHRGQYTSRDRPQRSRSRRRRASRSQSAGDKRRASSSTASQKRKSDSDKVVPETSSEDSSTESDDDKSLLTRSKHKLKPPKFDGKTSFESFWAQFQNCASHNKWSRPQQLVYLKNALEKDAANVLWDYGTEVTDSLSRLTRTLKANCSEFFFISYYEAVTLVYL